MHHQDSSGLIVSSAAGAGSRSWAARRTGWAAEGMDRAAMYAVLWCCLVYLMCWDVGDGRVARAHCPATVLQAPAQTKMKHTESPSAASGV